MKKILNEWKSYLKEETEDVKDDLLNKIREIFFGAYNSWDEQYKRLHDPKFEEMLVQLQSNAENKFNDNKKVEKVIRGANIGLSLYWSDNPNHGAGDSGMAGFVIDKKFEILESMLSDEEKELLKNGLMQQVIDSVREDRSNQMYPTTLAVSVGIINGIQVDDAYMTTSEGTNRYVIPILASKGYYDKSRPPSKSSPKNKSRSPRQAKMSLADMKAMMDKFSR